jgi:hypothetical protein
MDHSLALGLYDELLNTTDVALAGWTARWPGAEERLVKEDFLVALWNANAVDHGTLGVIPPAPIVQMMLPFLRQFRKDIDSGTDVLASLGVMGHGGVHREGPLPAALLQKFVELAKVEARLCG